MPANLAAATYEAFSNNFSGNCQLIDSQGDTGKTDQ